LIHLLVDGLGPSSRAYVTLGSALEGGPVAQVRFDAVSKSFGAVRAVDNLSLTVQDGEFLVLLGPSGCGKTTALRLTAGLEDVTEGSIAIGDVVVNDVSPQDRDIAMVFQSYALYPHLTVRRNIEFPLRQRDVDKAERARRAEAAAATLGLTELLDRKPGQLSGGQRQRVALARAIVRQPQVYLMDEPLSNLDAMLRLQTRADIVAMQRRLGTTVLYVTHDQVEAMTMGHRIAVMSEGRLQQVDEPIALYERPVNTFVATFLGNPGMSLASAAVAGHEVRVGDALLADTPLPDGPVTIGVRPESLALSTVGIPGIARFVEVLGADALVLCELASGERFVVRQSFDAPRPGPDEPVHLSVIGAAGSIHFFDASSGVRLEPTP
jgi:multiple sugar transport system ATP-binding protein